MFKINKLSKERKKARKILVVGENATKKHVAGGNSSGVKALYEIALLEGIKNCFNYK